MKPLVYKVFTTPGMTRPAHSRKRVTLNVVLSDIGKITQGETEQLVALFDEAQQTALANDILAKRAQAAEEEITKLKAQVNRLQSGLNYSFDYLNENSLNSIGYGSKAHNEMADALEESDRIWREAPDESDRT